MARNAYYAKIRAGLLEHMKQGRITKGAVSSYLVIHLEANPETGVWWGSATSLLSSLPKGSFLRDLQDELRLLERAGYIRTFRTHGRTGNYPVLIDKYECQFGVLRGKRLNAWESKDWRHPLYELCTEDVGETEPGSELGKEEILFKQPKPTATTPPTPPSGGKAAQMLATYQQKHGNLPMCQGLSKERERKCLARAKDHRKDWPAFLELWGGAVEKAGQHPWRDWRPSFDHFIANDTNWRKVLEGQYDAWKDEPQRGMKPSPAAVVAPQGKYAGKQPVATG